MFIFMLISIKEQIVNYLMIKYEVGTNYHLCFRTEDLNF